MSKSSKDYWAEREAEQLKHNITDEKHYDRRINQIYSDMLDNVQKEIESFYGKYAAKEGVTLAEAKKRVSKLDIETYERKAKRYVRDKDFSPQANEEMRLYNLTMKVNRLEMLKANIGLELINGHQELENFMGDILKGRTEEELRRQAGILGKTIKNNAQKANAIVNASFHGATFSDRIWQYQSLMKADLSKLLQSGLIAGKSPRLLAKDLKKHFSTSTFNAERLMRTELARVQTDAQKQSFERNGFDMYTFICNKNPSKQGTCDICKGLNGKHFKVKDMMPGTNAPPMHPHCRCSTAAYEDSAEYENWLDHLANGGATEEFNKHKDKKILENSENSGIIKLDIDELTPCLRRLKDNKIVDTEVFEITPKKSDFKDWEFDWTLPSKTGHSVYAIKAKEDERIQGLVALKRDERNTAVHIDIVEAAPFNNPHHKKFKQKEYDGVGGHLFAEAVRQSYDAGYGGAVYFMAKSNLIEHYQKELGAIVTNPRLRIMFIDEVAAKKLYDKYYGGK